MEDKVGPRPILLMSLWLASGGSERQLCEMALALDPKRFKVHVGCLRPGGLRRPALEAAGIPILTLPLRSFWSLPGLIRSFMLLRRYVRDHGIRLVHAFDAPTTLLLGFAWFGLRPAITLTSQRSYQDLVESPVFRLGVRTSHRVVDGVVVNCEAMREHLLRDQGQRPERIHLCYNGVDVRRFHRIAAAPAAGVPRDALVVGSVCVWRPEKDLVTLIRGFAACAAENPRLFLLLAGGGSERPRLEAEASRLGITSRCRFEGEAADVVPWLSRMDIFVLPSRSEALSNSLIEALACRCACVASRVGGMPELIEHGETGLLFDSGDVPALATCLRQLARDPVLRNELSERAVHEIGTRFTVEAAAVRLSDIYEDRMSSRG